MTRSYLLPLLFIVTGAAIGVGVMWAVERPRVVIVDSGIYPVEPPMSRLEVAQ